MMQYKFVKEKDPNNEYDCTRVTIEANTVSRQDLINSFIEFLGACGYNVEDLKEDWYA